MSAQEVKHDGTVQSIDGEWLKVSIISNSACASCKVSQACSVSEMAEKVIDIHRNNVAYAIGESVVVSLSETSGFKALIIGYMIPFLLLLTTLIVTSIFTENEVIIGLSSLLILVPYYFILFLLRNKIKKQFSFFVHKR